MRLQSFPTRVERDVYGVVRPLGKCMNDGATRARYLLETGKFTAFDIGETDEKHVWSGSGKSVGNRGGDIRDSDGIGMH